MKKSLFLAFLMVVLAVSWAMAANTIKQYGNIVDIIPDGSTAWDSKTLFPNGMAIKSIAFYPSAANDILTVREHEATGPTLFQAKDVSGGGLIEYYDGQILHPYILQTGECTFGTAANARIRFVLQAK